MIPQHSSKTNEHYTPGDIVDRARELMGGIDLDPASCAEANERIRATKFFTKEDDGLAQKWHGKVFLNPPGGTLKLQPDGRWLPANGGRCCSSMGVWWNSLVKRWCTGEIEQAFFVAFTLEILRLSQQSVIPVQAFPRCYPRERLCFGGEQPTHANVLVYIPKREARGIFEDARLREHFHDVGLCEGGSP